MNDIEYTRQNLMCVISVAVYGEHKVHDIQTNSGWSINPYGKKYAIVPDSMVQDIMATRGFCDITLNKSGTEVVSFVAREIPEIPEPEQPISELEQLRADIDYISAMMGVEL